MTSPRHPDPDDLLLHGGSVPAYTRAKLHQPAWVDEPLFAQATATQSRAFYMPDYLLGKPERVYRLSSGETCQTQYNPADKRHAWFVKNGNSEEFAVYGGFVWRGTDTSPNEQEYYQLWEGGTLGSRWCPAVWHVGVPFRRAPEVRYFTKASGQRSRDPYTDMSYLEIMAHHPSKMFPSGILMTDVLELAWYHTAAQKHERYWYAHSWGLVGFSAGDKFSSHVTMLTGQTAPVRKSWPGITPMVLPAGNPPPPLPSKESAVWQDATLMFEGNKGAYLRDAPFWRDTPERKAGAILSRNADGEPMTLKNNTAIKLWRDPNYFEDGYYWFGVWWGEHIGWMAQTRETFAEQFKLAEAPPPPTPPVEEPPADPDDTQPGPQTYVTHSEHDAALTALEARLDNVYRARLEALEQRNARLENVLRGIIAAYGLGQAEAKKVVEVFIPELKNAS